MCSVRAVPKMSRLFYPTESNSAGCTIPGAIAQLGERLNGIQEVRGSNPLGSTRLRHTDSSRPATGQVANHPPNCFGRKLDLQQGNLRALPLI